MSLVKNLRWSLLRREEAISICKQAASTVIDPLGRLHGNVRPVFLKVTAPDIWIYSTIWRLPKSLIRYH